MQQLSFGKNDARCKGYEPAACSQPASTRIVLLDRGMRQLNQVCIQEIQRAAPDQQLRHHMACSIICWLSHRLLPDTKPSKNLLLDLHRIDIVLSQPDG